jgi:hypothetical protein
MSAEPTGRRHSADISRIAPELRERDLNLIFWPLTNMVVTFIRGKKGMHNRISVKIWFVFFVSMCFPSALSAQESSDPAADEEADIPGEPADGAAGSESDITVSIEPDSGNANPETGADSAASDAAAAKLSPDEQLNSDDPKVRAKGVQTVVRNKIDKALPKLEEIVEKDSVPGIRRLACWAIGELKLKAGALTLRKAARSDQSGGVRTAAKRALEKIEGEGAFKEEEAAKTKEEEPGTCLKDTDCKGDRICIDAACQDIKKRPSLGWAMEASVIGFIGTAAVGGLSMYAALHPEDLLPAIPLAASATLVTVIVAPAVKSGSKSIRDGTDIPGSLTLRVIGWACFGLHLGGSLALAVAIPFHWLKKDEQGENWTPQTSWIMTNSIVGMVSLLTLSIEALVTRSQAKKRIAEVEAEEAQKRQKPKVSLSPFLAPVLTQGEATGASAGFVGRF